MVCIQSDVQNPSTEATYLENWPPALRALSFPSETYNLSPREIRDLLNHALLMPYHPAHPDDWPDLTRFLNHAITRFSGGCFVRIGGCSPKDSPFMAVCEGLVRTPADAMALLTTSERRVLPELSRALKQDQSVSLHARAWHGMMPWQEFRCFMLNRSLVGISQYTRGQEFETFEIIVENSQKIFDEVQRFFTKFKRVCHLNDVVFDIFLDLRNEGPRPGHTQLIELNPFDFRTDPCLFNWANPLGFSGRFVYWESNRTIGSVSPV